MREPLAREVEVPFDAVPFFGVESAAGQDIQGRATSQGDICDYKTRMVSRESFVDSVRKDTEMVVEEEDQDEHYSCKNA